jgi:dynein heavy chain 1
MSVRWEHVVNSFDSRHQLPYIPGASLEGHGGKHGVYVREFASVVSIFQDRTDSLIDMYTEITRTIDELETCAYTREAFSSLLGSIQKTIDKLNLEGYANLDSWVAELDAKIEAVLVQRLRAVIERWCVEFAKDGDVANRDTGSLASRNKAAKEAKVRSLSCTRSSS